MLLYGFILQLSASAQHKVLNKVNLLDAADTMPDKWILLIYLGQKTILNIQNHTT